MKKILNDMKNASIRIQLISVFMAIGVAISSIAAVLLSLNYKTMGRHGQYLEYISMINKLSEADDSSKKTINKLIYNLQENGKQQVSDEMQKVGELIEEIRSQTTSVDINLRLRVVQYLFQQYEEKAVRLISLMEEENLFIGQKVEESSHYDVYLETIEILSRIDTYIQEMISCSVKENNEFLQKALISSKVLQYALGVIIVVILGLAMYLGVRYSRYLERLMGNILSLTKRISEGNKHEILEVKEGPEEIREMISSFNGLIITMEELNRKADEKARLELQLKEAQLQGLQFQIQPHFLFNTLNAISMLAIMENDRKVYDLIMALSRFMRYSLKKTTALVSLKEEVDMVSQYLYILKARMGTKLEYEVLNKVDSEVMIPPFTLQPVVENAFRHGIEEKTGNGKIIVRITSREKRVILRVYNDGIGMSKEELGKLRLQCESKEICMDQEKHIGIENVVYRLNMLFGMKVKYRIYSSALRGTLFTIEILWQ